MIHKRSTALERLVKYFYWRAYTSFTALTLFNVAYNETDNISSWGILRDNNIFNIYLPYFNFLAQHFYANVSNGAAGAILHLWYGVATRFEPTISRSFH